MQRVKFGESYWCVIVTFNNVEVHRCIEIDEDETLVLNNYFKTKEEAEAMARKLRAVLKGAVVIEKWQGEEEICKQSQKEWIVNDGTIGDKRVFNDIVLTAYSIIKDKIVK